jgi:hypothetical protein
MVRTERIERTFSMPDGCQLDVSNISGSITVTGVGGERVQVLALKRWRSKREAESTEIEIGQEGNRVWARTSIRKTQGWWNLWGRREAAKVDYLIELPHRSQVKVSSVSASVEVRCVVGQVNIDAVSGQVTVRDLQGTVGIKSVSGNVRGQALHGRLCLETVSGRADLADSQLGALRVTSVSGPLRIATSLQPPGEYTARTVSGNVELLVPPTTSCSVDGHSISGRLRTTLAHTSLRQGFGTWHADVGDGGVPLSFDSVSGDLILKAVGAGIDAEATIHQPSQTAAQAEPDEAREPPVCTSAMDVLRAIEAGQLDVEEGRDRLRELKRRKEQHGDR